mmetsp:Transcript_10059/g.16075  ORF Transcript_10059/g.16075 Transcript_10059/m.16075 type:complete len:110 (+) Transcript_10059:1660-1989(+)
MGPTGCFLEDGKVTAAVVNVVLVVECKRTVSATAVDEETADIVLILPVLSDPSLTVSFSTVLLLRHMIMTMCDDKRYDYNNTNPTTCETFRYAVPCAYHFHRWMLLGCL